MESLNHLLYVFRMLFIANNLVRRCAYLGRLSTIMHVFNVASLTLRILIIPVSGVQQVTRVVTYPLMDYRYLIGMFFVFNRLMRLRTGGHYEYIQTDVLQFLFLFTPMSSASRFIQPSKMSMIIRNSNFLWMLFILYRNVVITGIGHCPVIIVVMAIILSNRNQVELVAFQLTNNVPMRIRSKLSLFIR